MSLPPLRFEPILRPLVWGGRRLETVLGRALPAGEDIGESWEIADLPDAVTTVRGGPCDGLPLDRLLAERPEELLGGGRAAADGRFPLLIKLLDAHRMLSVQVHPGADAAARAGVRPKTEAWFVLHAEPEAELLIGLRPGVGPEQVRAALADETLPELLAPHQARAGDVHLLSAGTVHCLGAGVVLAEVQQPSDTTYRLYDWGRGRPLHAEQALACIDWERPAHEPSPGGAVSCDAFEARWVRGGGAEPAADRCRAIIATSAGRLDGAPLAPGDTWLLPAACPPVAIDGADYIRVLAP